MKYYRADSRKISVGEYWNMTRGARFPLAVLFKVLRIPLKLPAGIPEPQPLRDRLIDGNTIPRNISERLNSVIPEFRELGFDQFWFHTLKDVLMIASGYGVQALHSSHLVIGQILFVSYKARERFALAFVSRFSDGTILATTDTKPNFRPLPNYIVQRFPGAGARRLWELHQKKQAALSTSAAPLTFANFEQTAAFADEASRASFEDRIRRGIWVEMTEAEVAALRAKLPPPLPA
jgi:hypothetical protein